MISSTLPRSTTWTQPVNSYIRCSFCNQGMARYSCGIGPCFKTANYTSCGNVQCWRRLLCISAAYRVVGVVPDEVMKYSNVEICAALVMFGREVVAKYEIVLDEDWQQITRIAASIAESDVAAQ